MCTRFIFAGHVYLYFIPFYGWIASLSMDIPHFIYSIVDGRLSCFHPWSIMNYTCTSFCVNIYFHFGGFPPGRGIAVSYVNYLTFWGIVRLFSEVTVPSLLSYQHSMKCMGFIFSVSSPTLVVRSFFFLSFGYPCIYEEVSYCGAHLHFPNDKDDDYLSVCLLATCMSSRGIIYSNPW